MSCKICGETSPHTAKWLEVCVDCIRDRPDEALPYALGAHSRIRKRFGLPEEAPLSQTGIPCKICAHECAMGRGDVGYCGLRENSEGRLKSKVSPERALLHYYLDPQVTNCCSAWFCPAGTGAGYPKYARRQTAEFGYYNLAIFFYGCNFDCVYCQNASHKELERAGIVSDDELVDTTLLNDRITCWCFFGGSPEPQLPFAINASRKVLEAADGDRVLRICFEWNGCGNGRLVERAAEIALKSGGNLKFDLKCHSETLSLALSGVSNKKAFQNFEAVFHKFYMDRYDLPLLTATTLLVPGYVDAPEVESIATFLSELDPGIPYSLLVFHPDFMMADLPITPLKQVKECLKAARKHLNRVHVGNLGLLGLRSVEAIAAA